MKQRRRGILAGSFVALKEKLRDPIAAGECIMEENSIALRPPNRSYYYRMPDPRNPRRIYKKNKG